MPGHTPPRTSRSRLGRRLFLTALAFTLNSSAPLALMCTMPIYAQILHATGPRPSFEVASIRPAQPNENVEDFGNPGDGYIARDITIRDLISYAYGIGFAPEVSGGPKWIGSDRFDINAKLDAAEAAALNKLSFADKDEQKRLMVQSLLADRLNLRVSFVKKQLPVYALVIAKGGLKCTKSADKSALPYANKFSVPPPPPAPPPPGGLASGEIRFTPRGWLFSEIAAYLAAQQEVGGRIVVDKTGLQGTYDCTASWAREGSDYPGPSFFVATQEMMGLKLQPEKNSVETLVIDHVERPSAN